VNEINLILPLGERFSRRIITPAYHQAIRERWLTDYAEASKGCVHLLDLVEVEQHATQRVHRAGCQLNARWALGALQLRPPSFPISAIRIDMNSTA
jgi:hypothetical protein